MKNANFLQLDTFFKKNNNSHKAIGRNDKHLQKYVIANRFGLRAGTILTFFQLF